MVRVKGRVNVDTLQWQWQRQTSIGVGGGIAGLVVEDDSTDWQWVLHANPWFSPLNVGESQQLGCGATGQSQLREATEIAGKGDLVDNLLEEAEGSTGGSGGGGGAGNRDSNCPSYGTSPIFSLLQLSPTKANVMERVSEWQDTACIWQGYGMQHLKVDESWVAVHHNNIAGGRAEEPLVNPRMATQRSQGLAGNHCQSLLAALGPSCFPTWAAGVHAVGLACM
ncbi:hypothetical protein BC835DRAFT_1306382 [Cytidiella melzeri]|nr:hypothetical protein BC835DRAFT_1306382 [Cytidiella melzeri]